MKWIRRIAGLIFAIAALLIGLVFYAQNAAVERAKRRIDVKVSPVAFVDDAAAFERGKYLYESRGCAECHGLDGAGRTLVDDGKGTKLAGPNITRGNARLAGYQPIDWVRSIRHGLAPDGRVLRLMPSEDYSRLTDADLAACGHLWLPCGVFARLSPPGAFATGGHGVLGTTQGAVARPQNCGACLA